MVLWGGLPASELRGNPVRREFGNTGAAPATVNGELLSTDVTKAMSLGKTDKGDDP
ncbi:hypothetical protein GGD46_001982 [Rhizobium lusitanum]|uniref:Uncharacterized protein n=1 Tax=Rhizobium lusitanum TaxID=293958 RepID=A0A7X0MBN7_9HYPH|nr:hypothetical protein [Rhizobium lusitanum]